MTKRQYIDLVRQFATQAKRNNASYAPQVGFLHQQYMASVVESGAGEAEQTKEGDWSEAFLAREYGKVDRDFDFQRDAEPVQG